jgi:DNA-binding HxlR family transcriptional regulator
VLGSDYDGQVCASARALEVVGQRWTLLILRDLFLGCVRFDDLVESLGVTRSVLTRRLSHLEEHQLITRELYQRHPERYEYRLTAKGAELLEVVARLLEWGETYYPHPDGRTRLLLHTGCGGAVHSRLTCAGCGDRIGPTDVTALPGPAREAMGAPTERWPGPATNEAPSPTGTADERSPAVRLRF